MVIETKRVHLLNTLKDFDFFCTTEECKIYRELIQKMIIKWVKVIEQKKDYELKHLDAGENALRQANFFAGTVHHLKYIFDLSEDEVKRVKYENTGN